ncbi:solute carrier family 2, facilitated glucose transporter member 8-like [Chrysoperla carnea]|uniref:solute carrier family 2, facilitated glucose transporter member 8-like n=1 Tax=Chrysoperla carnea TaxID=189513 RepID=UPI001D094320|nr:solute carrier family 2, facilitated glucose transporter member 8-like [Chrysoperla carnea]
MKNKISRLFSIHEDIEENRNHELYWVQYFFGFVATLAMLNCGTQLSWFGPALPILQDEELSPIGVVTNIEASWIFSLLQLGSLPGALFGSYLANKIGRKNTLIFTIIPSGFSYLLIIFIKNVYMLYVARIFAGLSVGITMVALPTYLTEISSPRIRGILGTFTVISMCFSWIINYILQPIITIQLNCVIIILQL